MRNDLAAWIRRRGDLPLATAITALALAEAALDDLSAAERLEGAALALTLGVAASIRSRQPLLLLSLMVVVTIASAFASKVGVLSIESLGLFLVLSVYNAALHATGMTLSAGAALTFVLFAVSAAGYSEDPAAAVAFDAILFGAPWVTGRTIRQRRLNDSALAEEKARAAAAIVAERAQIARELHDVVAHSISVIVLQARGGRRVLETEPMDARDAFGAIERTGEQALDEMRRLLGMLRRTDEEVALAPQPSLNALDRLVDQVQAAGLPVRITVEGTPRELPPGVDLSAYRIVQEGLTNSLKHAGDARAHVRLRYLPDELELEVVDDGAGPGGPVDGGYGLIGMRERVTVYGGELEAGHRPEGGFSLRVRLPIGSAPA